MNDKCQTKLSRILAKLDRWLFSSNPFKTVAVLLFIPFGVSFVGAVIITVVLFRWFV